MAVAAAIAAVVAVYQGFVDLSFLNTGFWTYMIRASGTLADPNKLGAVTGSGPSAWWCSRADSNRVGDGIVTVAAFAIGVAAAWLCGSRTGLAAVATSLAIAMLEAVRYWWRTAQRRGIDVRRAVLVGAGAVLLAVAMVLVLQSASTHTIVARGTLGYLPFFGDRGIVQQREGASVGAVWLWARGDRDDQGASD